MRCLRIQLFARFSIRWKQSFGPNFTSDVQSDQQIEVIFSLHLVVGSTKYCCIQSAQKALRMFLLPLNKFHWTTPWLLNCKTRPECFKLSSWLVRLSRFSWMYTTFYKSFLFICWVIPMECFRMIVIFFWSIFQK